MKRWVWFSDGPAPVGHSGPFGPIEAETEAAALSIAQARARSVHVELASLMEMADPPGLRHIHRWGPWHDDPVGVVRECPDCGELDVRPEG